VLDPGRKDVVNRPESAWPPERVEPTAVYLDAARGKLGEEPSDENSTTTYDAATGLATFTLDVVEDFEIIGPSCLRLWVESDGSDATALYATIQKADASGPPILPETLPSTLVPVATGQLRASHRELNEDLSTPLAPVHRHEREQFLEPGQVVLLEIGLWP